MKYFVLAIVVFFSVIETSEAALFFCDNRTISRIEVQAERDDNHPYENGLMIRLGSACNGTSAVYLKPSSPVFDHVLSLALAAKIAGKKIWLHVNTTGAISGAQEISVIGIEE